MHEHFVSLTLVVVAATCAQGSAFALPAAFLTEAHSFQAVKPD
jgi:hypothetical protein